MKLLKIYNGKGYYINKESASIEISKVSKEDILYLLDQLTSPEVEVELDSPEDNEINNPAQRIVYENIYKKFSSLLENQEGFTEESKRIYKDALDKYRQI